VLPEQAPGGPGKPLPGTPGDGAQPQPAPGASVKPDGSRVFRLPGAVVLFWAWVVFAVANLVDIAISGRDRTSVQIAIGLVVVTAVMYACALRPRVITDSDGITVLNPLRDHRIPWGSVTAIDLGDSVQVHCRREPGAKKAEKVIYSWALYSPRRARYRAELRSRTPGWGPRRHTSSVSQSYGRMPAEAAELKRKSSAEIMCRELGDIARQARESGAVAGPRVATWAWPALVAIAVPAAALALVIVIR
jgi:hypothetical protein